MKGTLAQGQPTVPGPTARPSSGPQVQLGIDALGLWQNLSTGSFAWNKKSVVVGTTLSLTG